MLVKMEEVPGPPLPILLARNLVAALAVPGFVVDADQAVMFYNDAAGELIGRHFEESGRLTREEWGRIGPVDELGRAESDEGLPLSVALRDYRPSHATFRILTDNGGILTIDLTAMPLIDAAGVHGAIVIFVPVGPNTSAPDLSALHSRAPVALGAGRSR
jgi:PAS domain-containing protein